MGATSRDSGWMSYDSVAGIYERVAVPWFAPIAEDLVALIDLRPGQRVLDLGTGTGLAASLVGAAVAPGGAVIGVDPSLGMLRLITPTPGVTAVAAMAPGLPFADGAFDAVVSNFAVSHLPDLTAGLGDVARVLRRDGRFGCTSWGPRLSARPDNDLPEADAVVATVRERHDIDATPPAVDPVPFEEHLQKRESLTTALTDAGLTDVQVRSHRYPHAFTAEDYVSGWGSRSRHIRYVIGEQRWSDFARDAAAALRDTFGEYIRGEQDVQLATARRPPVLRQVVDLSIGIRLTLCYAG